MPEVSDTLGPMAAGERKYSAVEGASRRRRVSSVLIRPIVVLSVIAGVLAAGQLPASACSCAVGDIEGSIQQADGALIGSLVSSTPASNIEDAEHQRVGTAHTLEVTEWIKGQREPGAFTVYSDPYESTCSFAPAVGREVAVFVWVNEGRATVSLCSVHDAASVRATLRPPALSDNPGVFLATGSFEPSHVLDVDGGLVASLPAGRGDLHTTCGGSIIAEHRHNQVVLIDVATLEETEVLQLARPTQQVLCEGGRVLALAGTGEFHRVYDARTREPVSRVVAETSRASLVDDTLIYLAATDEDNPQAWRSLDLQSGAERVVIELSTLGKRMESVDFSPDGSRIALTLAEGNQSVLDLEIISVAEGETITRTINTHVASVRWLDDEQLLVRTDSGGFPDTDVPFIASAADLTTLVELSEDVYWPTHLDDNRLVGLRGGAFQSMPLGGGPVEVLNEVPSNFQLQLLRFPEPVRTTTTGSARSAPIETPIPSPVIEAIPASVPVIVGIPSVPDVVPADGVSVTDAKTIDSASGGLDPPGGSRIGTIAIVLAAAVLAGIATAIFRRRRNG